MVEKTIERGESNLQTLIKNARGGLWDNVDSMIAGDGVTPEFVEWAVKTGLYLDEENLRDLAASIIQASDEKPDQDTIKRLGELHTSDSGKYVRFRAACALFKHGDQSAGVMDTLEQAKKDPDIADIAETLLDTLHTK